MGKTSQLIYGRKEYFLHTYSLVEPFFKARNVWQSGMLLSDYKYLLKIDYPQKCLPQNCLPVGKSEVGIIITTYHQKCLP